MAITNAALAQQISELVDYWRTRDVQFAEWLGGSPTGGPFGDGRYPLTDYLGVVQYLYCPAALESGVASSSSAAAVQAALAGAAKDAALIAQAAAEAARNLALTYRNEAELARDQAQLARDEAANSQAIALTHRNNAAGSAAAAAATYASLQADLDSALDVAIAQAVADAEAQADAAASSASDAADSAAAAAASASTAGTHETNAGESAGEAAASAAAAAASEAAAHLFDPALYARKDIDSVFAKSIRTLGSIRAVGWHDVWVTDPLATAVEIGTVSNLGYVLVYNRNTSQYGDLRIHANSAVIATNGGSTETLKVLSDGAIHSPAKHNFYGWNGAYYNGPAVQVGVSAGTGYLHGYNGSNATYIPLRIEGSDVTLSASNVGKAAATSAGFIGVLQNGVWHTSNDGYNRFHFSVNARTYFSSPDGYEWRHSNDAALMTLSPAGDSSVVGDAYATGFRWRGDANFYFYNTSGYTYGSWRIGGTRNGYMGLVLDDARLTTFMSNGSASGIYFPNLSRWMVYDDGAYFRIGVQPIVEGRGGCLHYGDTFNGARVFVRNGGGAVGNTEGDLTLIW